MHGLKEAPMTRATQAQISAIIEKRQKQFTALYRAYLEWLSEVNQQEKTFEELCAVANCTAQDVDEIEEDYKYRDAVEELKTHILRFNVLLKFVRCYEAVDRIMKDRRTVESVEQFNFHENNVIAEAGLSHEEIFNTEYFNPRFPLGEYRELLTLKSLSAERYLYGDSESDLNKVEYVRALTRLIKNQTITIDAGQSLLDINESLILQEMDAEFIYLPPKHRSMVERGVMAVSATLHDRYVYGLYKEHRAKNPDTRVAVKDFLKEESFYNLVWLEVVVQADNLGLIQHV